MEYAIHKSSGKVVSSYKLTKSLEWIGKEREEFIAPYHEIGNWTELDKKDIKEVKVSFVTKHKRTLENGTIIFVSPHFRIETEGAIENPNNESEEHRLAKEYIYDLAIENLLLVDNQKLSQIGEIEDIKIECQSGKKRADVLIKFKNFHEIYGKGIAFEIQISPQKIERTEERNYDRATYGYSIVWLWSGDINNADLKVIPYSEAIKDFHKQLKIQSERLLWDIDYRATEKVHEIIESIEKKLNSYKLQKDLLDNKLDYSLNQLQKIHETIEENTRVEIRDQLTNKIKDSILDNIKSEKINIFIEKIYQEYLKDHETYIETIIRTKFKEQLEERIKEILNILPIDKSSIQLEVHKIAQDFLKDIDLNLMIERQIKEKERFIENNLNDFLSKEMEAIIKQDIESKLSNELLNLKSDSISNFSKSRTSLYIECPLCKKDTHIVNCNILRQGDLFKIICNTCKEKEGERQNKDTDA